MLYELRSPILQPHQGTPISPRLHTRSHSCPSNSAQFNGLLGELPSRASPDAVAGAGSAHGLLRKVPSERDNHHAGRTSGMAVEDLQLESRPPLTVEEFNAL